MNDQLYLTADGAARMKDELARLVGPERENLAKRLRSAVQQGDLSENADYHKAKEDQAFLEGRIQELEYLLGNATIVDNHSGHRSIIEIGAKITIKEDDSTPETYLMVGAKEADPKNGKISYESPIGESLMGKKEGDIVYVDTPGGRLKFTILHIQ